MIFNQTNGCKNLLKIIYNYFHKLICIMLTLYKIGEIQILLVCKNLLKITYKCFHKKIVHYAVKPLVKEPSVKCEAPR